MAQPEPPAERVTWRRPLAALWELQQRRLVRELDRRAHWAGEARATPPLEELTAVMAHTIIRPTQPTADDTEN